MRTVIAGKYGYDLQAYRIDIGEEARHHSKHSDLIGQPHHGTQWQYCLTARDSYEGIGHDVDAFVHRQELTDLGLVDDENFQRRNYLGLKSCRSASNAAG